ncbi:MAG: alpha/beta hydrolase [Acidimicrobiia bacterium]|nr:alpha/beta hydrolase [Acidimicrobiia bacterium]
MPTTRDGDVELWYDTSGDGPATLVLTGGFGLLDAQFAEIRPLLVERYRVLDWHYRGSGRSTRDVPLGFDRWVDDLELVLDAAGVGPGEAVLWGTSTGSPLTIAHAARYPERVAGIAVHPFVDGRGAGRVFEGFRVVGESFGHEALALLTAWIGCAGSAAMTPEMLRLAAFEAEAFARVFEPKRLGELLAVLADVDVTSELAALASRELPVLLLIGDSGRMGLETSGTRRAVERVRDLVPAAELAVVADAGGTYCMIERPRAALDALLPWLERVAGSAGRSE